MAHLHLCASEMGALELASKISHVFRFGSQTRWSSNLAIESSGLGGNKIKQKWSYRVTACELRSMWEGELDVLDAGGDCRVQVQIGDLNVQTRAPSGLTVVASARENASLGIRSKGLRE